VDHFIKKLADVKTMAANEVKREMTVLPKPTKDRQLEIKLLLQIALGILEKERIGKYPAKRRFNRRRINPVLFKDCLYHPSS
jgi:hypothetical protein